MSAGEPAVEPLAAVIAAERVIAIVRAPDATTGHRAATKLLAAGARVLEVSLTTPDAWAVVGRLISDNHHPSVRIGVGTVTSDEQVRRAAGIGAAFVLTPALVESVVESAAGLGIPSIPGCATPAEMLRAESLGALMVKVFPANLWSPGVLRDALHALPNLRCVPTGGISLTDAEAWLHAGAVAVGLGSSLSSAPTVAVAARLASLRRADA
jgi:2-dehydro-3-deoxyphosphogluconate aldolase/(4S)-4-hydroxy-2-oxoglutarate aldolase